MPNASDTAGHSETNVAPEATPAVRRKLSTTAAEIMAERNGLLPVWIRTPKSGTDHYCGLSRAKLYELAGKRYIHTRSLREPGRVKGVRLFHLGSILDFIGNCETEANKEGGL